MTVPRHLRLLLFCLATAGSAPAQVAGQGPADLTPTQRLFDAYRTRSAPQGKRMMQRVGRRAPFERAAARALEAAWHFPDHPIMTPLAADLNATLATLMP